MPTQVYTTGQAARVAFVSQQTIIRCIDRGHLKGFRVPGSKFRRIARPDLLAWMLDNGIPLHDLGPLDAEEQAEVDRRKAAAVGPLKLHAQAAPATAAPGANRLERGVDSPLKETA